MLPNPKKINPAFLARIEKFQRTFVRYFPDLHDIEEAATEWNWLHVKVVLNPMETVRRSKVKAEVRKVVRAIRLLSQHQMPYWLSLPTLDRDVHDRVSEWEKEIVDMLFALGEMEEEGLTKAVTDKFVADAERGIDALPETANVNWDAVHAVEALRLLWWRNTGKRAPSRALNPASRFYSYLKDGFSFLQIAGDPASAFKRWAARWPYDEVV